MVITQGAYASADGLCWVTMPFKKVAEDNTAPMARFDPVLGKYVVYVRRWLPCWPGVPCCPFGLRQIGQCLTSNLSDWQQEVPASATGCEVTASAQMT